MIWWLFVCFPQCYRKPGKKNAWIIIIIIIIRLYTLTVAWEAISLHVRNKTSGETGVGGGGGWAWVAMAPHLTFDCAPFIAMPPSCPRLNEGLPPPPHPSPLIKTQLRHWTRPSGAHGQRTARGYQTNVVVLGVHFGWGWVWVGGLDVVGPWTLSTLSIRLLCPRLSILV